MDAKQFLAEFGHIANAPGGVTRLRELVFSLASDGKLIPDCEPIEKTHLDKVADFVMGQAPPGNQCNTMGNGTIFVKTGEFGELYPIVREWTTKPLKFAKQGDVLICVVGATVGKLNLAIDCAIGRSVAAIRPRDGLKTKYLYFMLMSFTLRLRSGSRGSAQGVIGKSELSSVKLRVPSDNEQYRIVAKVEELIALCDKLEVLQQARRTLQNALRQSTLQAVASASSSHELRNSWTRLADNFGRLFYAPEDVDELRQTVLDLALSGYLSNLDQLDEPSPTLKAKILAAKERGIADGSFSRKKHVKPEKLEETTLPAHWESITLDEAISTIDAGWSPACLPNPRDNENKWAVLKTTAVQVLRFLPLEHKELPASLDPRPQYQVEVGDILITRAGPRNRVGICCVVDTAPSRLMISDKLIRFHIVDDLINPHFVALCLSAGEPGRTVERLKSGMAESQMNISQDRLRSITIPLPPIEEQQRILEKTAALMKMIDSYSERLCKENRLAEQAAAASVSSITGIAIEQEEEPMKVPQTELIAPLRLGTAPDIKAQAPLATILARHNGEMSAKDLWQRFNGEIDAFYAQLKTEVAHGWILEPTPAEVREKTSNTVSA
ncbi:restriction endonuclease subunit S [Pectobacterium brasiliense]|uniref:restriction endonuclease subunit S n=1 Tax=Pectobacterium brasiliense TaxID=180957 RepID=UPI0032EB58B3